MLIPILRAVTFASLLAVTPVLAQTAPSAHALPFPGDVLQFHAIELALGGASGAEWVLRSILAEADLLMAVNGYPTLDAVREAGAQRTDRSR